MSTCIDAEVVAVLISVQMLVWYIKRAGISPPVMLARVGMLIRLYINGDTLMFKQMRLFFVASTLEALIKLYWRMPKL